MEEEILTIDNDAKAIVINHPIVIQIVASSAFRAELDAIKKRIAKLELIKEK